jgi:hypothetical protein
MHTLFLGFFICVLFPPFATQFLTAPIPTNSYYANRLNLNCSGRTDTLYNNITTYENDGDSTGASYCFIAIVTSLVNNLNQIITYRDAIYLWNMYRHIAINQCNFSTIMDIGYGSCTPYYYETATSIQLCICSTNNCSVNYTSCQASVNQTLSSPPPLLPVLQPTLSNTITCQDFYANYSAIYNITPPMYAGCQNLITLSEPDSSKCSTYTPNHTVLCGILRDSTQGSYQQKAFIEGDYEPWMNNMIVSGISIASNSSFGYLNQTSTSIAVISNNSGQSYLELCLCTTNNCNVDFTTCASGISSTVTSATNLSEKPFYSKLLVTILLAISLSFFKMSNVVDLS